MGTDLYISPSKGRAFTAINTEFFAIEGRTEDIQLLSDFLFSGEGRTTPPRILERGKKSMLSPSPEVNNKI